MKKRLLACFLLFSKLITLVGCTGPDNSKQVANSDSSNVSTTVEIPAKEEQEIETTEAFEVPIVDYSSQGLNIQKEEIIIDEISGNIIAAVRYLEDKNKSIVCAYIYSRDLDIRIENNDDIEREVTDTLNRILKNQSFIIDVYESGRKTYTLYQPTDEYPIAKCEYIYSEDGTLSSTKYYDKDGNLLMDVAKKDEEKTVEGQPNIMQTIYCTSKTGCKYEKKYIKGELSEIIFYNENNEIADSITMNNCTSEPIVIDDDNALQVITESPTDKKTYTINQNGRIIYEQLIEYKPNTNKEKVNFSRTIRLDKQEKIYGTDSSNYLVVKIDYYIETIESSDGNIVERPIKTELTSPYLKQPIVIVYEQNQDGTYKPRDNQMKTDSIKSRQGFMEIEDELEYYTKKLKKKHTQKNGDDVVFTNEYITFQYHTDGTLITSKKHENDSDDYIQEIKPVSSYQAHSRAYPDEEATTSELSEEASNKAEYILRKM